MFQNKSISRRDFLKLTLTSLAACGRALGIPSTPSPTLTPTLTSTNTRYRNHNNLNERP